MVKRIIHCPKCNQDVVAEEKEISKSDQIKELVEILAIKKEVAIKMVETRFKIKELTEKLKDILENLDTTPYEKKLALFNMIKNLDVGGMSLEKKKRTNWLLQGHLYSELAKNCMEEYKKTTVKSFSKAE